MKTGSVLDAVRSGRPRIFEENIKSIRQAFSRSPMKFIHTAARELEFRLTRVHKALHERLRLYAYKVQMLQRMQPNDKLKQKEFADNMLQQLFENEEFSQDEELLTASNTDSLSINFLSHGRLKEREGESFPLLVLYLW